jgi:hypothetical protein
MNKRILKRHKRDVSRARNRGGISEPDLRTPEQLRAAREASRAVGGRWTDGRSFYDTLSPHRAGARTSGTVDVEVAP